MSVLIRKACMADVKGTYELLNSYAKQGELLGRSLSSLYDNLRDFQVASHPDGALAGVCALHICWENLAEIRSLAVFADFHNRGIGRLLVKQCLADAKALQITEVFTLTYQPHFFEKLGFSPIDKKDLPHKVWADCLNCPKFPDCNEEAMVWRG
ncbi:MAG: N-acetyltransferase [Desulfobulbaceae bacterium]|jgi:amino-acid N-acetyltransferase|nr:N-acetyltransferase [Desulfobulbaceae bacterium]